MTCSELKCLYCGHHRKNVDLNRVCLAMTAYGLCNCKKSGPLKKKHEPELTLGQTDAGRYKRLLKREQENI